MSQYGPGARNVYICKECGRDTVTIHRDTGTTPMLIRCRAGEIDDTCQGMAVSQFYRHTDLQPVWEWYLPTSKRELRKLDPATRGHVLLGGLVLRRIEGQ